jgi:hypothetical protein
MSQKVIKLLQFGKDLNVGMRKQFAGCIRAIAIKQEIIEGDRYAHAPKTMFERPHPAIIRRNGSNRH